jgi:DNA-binding NarL/FixJ family response regulator
MDLRMPQMDGVAATHAIKRELHHTLVLILTAVDESRVSLTASRRVLPDTCSKTLPLPG